MAFLHNIKTVAKYEAKTLRRSWFFRLFSIGALIILTFMNIGLFSPVGDEPWGLVAVSSSVPLINLYLLNIGQAIIVIFLAADFLKRDKKLDTNEVLYTRSMSNFEYITGKTWGILKLFLGLDIIILSIALIINIISKIMSVDILAYLWYLLIVCVPTLIFSLGLAFMLMSVIRNQAVTFLILLGIAALNMFWLWYRAGSLFDYMAFGMPIYKSGIIGFDNLSFILNQRLFYLFLGLAFILATVFLFKRLPQSKLHTTIAIVLFFFFISGAGFCGFSTFSVWKRNIHEKNLVIQTNRQFENAAVPAISDAFIDLSHKGKTFEATAQIKFVNDNRESLDRYIFSLNPGLTVSKISSNGRVLSYKKTNHIIEIDPGKILQSGQGDSVTISYAGTINEAFCYPGNFDNFKVSPNRIEMLNINKRQAFISDDYVLLTPETHWYPFAGLNYYPSNPARIKVDFTRFSLRVKTEGESMAVSQGIMKQSDGYFYYTPESPLTGLTLAIGNYIVDSIRVDSVKYLAYHFPGHDYYKKDLAELKDTLSFLVSGIMRDLETNFSTGYPFRTLSIVEVPIQFYSYPKMNTQTRAELQPSMILLPEKLATIYNAGFRKRFTRMKRNNARNNVVVTDKELQVRIFNDFIRNTFISGENFRYINGVAWNEPVRYRLGPSFYFFKNNFYSSEYPVINSVFESHLQKVRVPEQGGFRSFMGSLSDNDRANLILRSASFKDLLARNPGSDTLRSILTIKGDYLFNLVRARAGIEEFNKWFIDYMNRNKFTRIDILKLNSDIKNKFGFEFYPYLNEWFNSKDQPGFLFTDIQADEIVVGDRVRCQVTFTASNPEPVAGLFNVSFRTGGQVGRGGGQQMTAVFQGSGGGGSISISMQGRGMEAADLSRIVLLGPEEARKIGIILDAPPRALLINTLVAKNIPGEITIPINDIKKVRNRTLPGDSEEKLPSLPRINEPNEKIVDNEDPGFDEGRLATLSPLKRFFGITHRRGEEYQQLRLYNIPDYWQRVAQSTYYGKYILSSVYTRSGTGDKSVTWATTIDEPGYYDIYCYIGKSGDKVVIKSGGPGAPPPPPGAEPQGDSPYKDLHYKIFHDEGEEEITVDYENAEAGWNNLGRYYLSPDTAKVVLTNQSSGRVVIGDAIKWVKVK